MVTEKSLPVAHDAPTPVTVRDNGLRSGEQQSWAGLFRGGKVREDAGAIPFLEPVIVNGKKVAQCDADELTDERDRWKAALVGYVFGSKPSFSSMQRFVKEQWSHVGAVKVFGLESGIFVFDFQGRDLSMQILDEGPWTFSSRPMILRPWTPEVSLSRKEEIELPLWVKLYGLNLRYWGDRSLGCIASVLGRPICADRRTVRHERLSFARICISIKVADGLPATICIAQEAGTLVEQPVHYDWSPPLCSVCKVFGHGEKSYPIAAINKMQEDSDSVQDVMQVEDSWQRPRGRRGRGKHTLPSEEPSGVATTVSPATPPDRAIPAVSTSVLVMDTRGADVKKKSVISGNSNLNTVSVSKEASLSPSTLDPHGIHLGADVKKKSGNSILNGGLKDKLVAPTSKESVGERGKDKVVVNNHLAVKKSVCDLGHNSPNFSGIMELKPPTSGVSEAAKSGSVDRTGTGLRTNSTGKDADQSFVGNRFAPLQDVEPIVTSEDGVEGPAILRVRERSPGRGNYAHCSTSPTSH
ncbi:uncharacterized protein LOC122671107 [Telopea speciosissima]|uniref:uncharacterized protein LOC122671107 n=1 Tax=Telopea speciosissima TaxID=54955 RepID=UPI001CC3C183|nr:uncharacterized protein LOC122671107 [Telopea speciosissima]